jgi:hypothetical protein
MPRVKSTLHTQDDEREFSMEELVAAAEATHYANLAVADLEAEFLKGGSQFESVWASE